MLIGLKLKIGVWEKNASNWKYKNQWIWLGLRRYRVSGNQHRDGAFWTIRSDFKEDAGQNFDSSWFELTLTWETSRSCNL